MNRLTQWRKFLILIAGIGMMGAAADQAQQRVTMDKIGSDFLLVGRTGKLIGAFSTIEGNTADRKILMDNPLYVDTVDGKKLEQPILLSVRGTKDFVLGSRQVLRGYENCGMIGTPADPDEKGRGVVQQPLHFDSWFEVTRVVNAKAAK